MADTRPIRAPKRLIPPPPPTAGVKGRPRKRRCKVTDKRSSGNGVWVIIIIFLNHYVVVENCFVCFAHTNDHYDTCTPAAVFIMGGRNGATPVARTTRTSRGDNDARGFERAPPAAGFPSLLSHYTIYMLCLLFVCIYIFTIIICIDIVYNVKRIFLNTHKRGAEAVLPEIRGRFGRAHAAAGNGAIIVVIAVWALTANRALAGPNTGNAIGAETGLFSDFFSLRRRNRDTAKRAAGTRKSRFGVRRDRTRIITRARCA